MAHISEATAYNNFCNTIGVNTKESNHTRPHLTAQVIKQFIREVVGATKFEK
jgi:hypothetical protein